MLLGMHHFSKPGAWEYAWQALVPTCGVHPHPHHAHKPDVFCGSYVKSLYLMFVPSRILTLDTKTACQVLRYCH